MHSAWFPQGPDHLDEATWIEDLKLLEQYQEKLLATLDNLDQTTLTLRRAGKKRTIGSELIGMAVHDAYHAGQIRLLALLAPR